MKNTLQLAIVDDDANYSSLTAFRFTKLIPHCVYAGGWNNAETFLHDLSTAHTLPDIVLMDIQLQGMSGMEATLMLKQHYPSVKVIAFTQWDNPERVARMLMCGCVSFICKTLPAETQTNIVLHTYHHTHQLSDHPLANVVLQQLARMELKAPLN